MEEDTGKSLHVGGATGRIHGADYSLVDYNRAGIPLIEIVTKPIMGTREKAPAGGAGVRRPAARPAARPRRLRRPHGAGLAALRRQPVAGARPARATLGTRTETKNVNSLRSVERAVRYEIGRHAAVLDGGRVDPAGDPALARGHRGHHRRAARSPTPRTTATSPSPTWCRSRRRASGSRSCAARCPSRRASAAPGCSRSGASPTSRCATPSAPARSAWSRRPSPPAPRPQAARKWWLSELARRANEQGVEHRRRSAVTPADVARVQALVDEGRINDKLARQVFDGVLAGEGTPDEVVEPRGLAVVSDEGALSAAPSTGRSRRTPTSPTRSATARWPPPAR